MTYIDPLINLYMMREGKNWKKMRNDELPTMFVDKMTS